jgi:trimeric autotransporter adhesin
MKTNQQIRRNGYIKVFGSLALLTVSSMITAQNSSWDADAIPVPGFGSNNAVFGGQCMLSNIFGGDNTAIGYFVMQNNQNGGANTSTGYASMISNTDGGLNSSYGAKSMYSNTTGYGNNAYGCYALGQNGIGNLNSGFGYQSDVAANNFDEATAVGSNAIVNSSYRVWLGSSVTDVWTTNSYNISDGRFKRNVTTEQVKGLDFIKRLRPVTYNFDAKALTEHMTQNMSAEKRQNYMKEDFDRVFNKVQTGFIAQEVEEAAKASGYNFSGVHSPKDKTDTYGVSYYQFVVPLVKAVQEQQQMIEAQQQTIANQQKAIDALLNANTNAKKALQQNGTDKIGFTMEQNNPNPFTLETTVTYNLPKEINSAYMAVYDLSGKQITTFPIDQKGEGSMIINAEKLAPGIYIYSIIGDNKVLDSKRMVVATK